MKKTPKDMKKHMKKIHHRKMPLVGLFVVLIVGIVAAGAFAFGGMGKGMFGPNEEAQAAMDSGDYTGWRDAMTDDLTEERFNTLRQRHQEMAEHHETVEAALESGDFAAWQAAMGDHGMASEMTEEGFAVMQQIHTAMEDGDVELAHTLRAQIHDELDIEGCAGMGGQRKMGARHGGLGR